MIETRIREVIRQASAHVRFDWGPAAASELRQPGSCLVVVDVLSFTTAVSVATGRGMEIYPYRFGDEGAAAYASAEHAKLAAPRDEVSAERPWSLAPETLAGGPFTARLVLPSPNGSAIAAAAGGVVVAACLRNATAVVGWLVANGYGAAGRSAAVIAAGERWPDGSLRPAIEDGLGAGVVLRRLAAAGAQLSAEAVAAATAYEATDVHATVSDCASAHELRAMGYPGDVEAALVIDVDRHVPVRNEGAGFVAV